MLGALLFLTITLPPLPVEPIQPQPSAVMTRYCSPPKGPVRGRKPRDLPE